MYKRQLCDWPKIYKKLLDREKVKTGKVLLEIIAAIRKFKAKEGLSMKAELGKVEIFCSREAKKRIKEMEEDLRAVGNAKAIKFSESKRFSVKIS